MNDPIRFQTICDLVEKVFSRHETHALETLKQNVNEDAFFAFGEDVEAAIAESALNEARSWVVRQIEKCNPKSDEEAPRFARFFIDIATMQAASLAHGYSENQISRLRDMYYAAYLCDFARSLARYF